MRHLILMRHAETAYARLGQSDFDRALTDQGLRHARNQARLLEQHGMIPDKVLCSAALRTQTTWDIMAREFLDSLSMDFAAEIKQALYNAPGHTLMEHIHTVDNQVDNLLVIAHNPGIHELMLELAEPVEGPYSDEALRAQNGCPPATMAIFVHEGRGWFDITNATVTLKYFVPPKD